MKIKVVTPTEEQLIARDYQDSLEIFIDDKQAFHACDGEPEDNTLSRNFSSCYGIVDLMKLAYEVGKGGGEFVVTEIKGTEE